MSSTGDELRALVRAGWRLLALETFEEDRAVGLLERVATALERRCITWSCAAGLGTLPWRAVSNSHSTVTACLATRTSLQISRSA